MKSHLPVVIIVLVMAALLSANSPTMAATIDDSNALAGVNETKTLFDIGIKDPEGLEFYLRVIRETYDGLVRQGQKPDMVIVFRGPSVLLVNSQTWSYSEEDEKTLKQAAVLVKELHTLGVHLEACSIATELFKVDNTTILPEIKVVGNTFISLTGYQMKGYALIPIH